ncbi:MAG: glycosyltransferase family 4 protein [Cyanobacteriota bacterium]|nr:glycosyltransferase family 4 protein [Cyanobacteriota bacterium]
MTKLLRTLFITKNIPHPPIGGSALRNWQNMNIMMKYGPVAVFSLSTWTPKHTSAPGITLWKHCNVAIQRSLWEMPERRLWWLRPQGHPEADWAYANQAARELDELLNEFKPDLVIFEEVWLYRYLSVVKRHQCLIILDEHNLEADIFEQKYRSVEKFRLKLRAKVQLPQIKSMEREFIRKADLVWVCSDEDTSLLQEYYGEETPCYVVPNGVNVADYDYVRLGKCSPPEGFEDKSRNIIFLGQLSYSPNTVAVELLLDQIYPRIKKLYPDCRLLLVGRSPTQSMLEAAKADPTISITGWIADVKPYLAAASLMIVPLLQGGGTRLKILEAFAAGCPVVSTAKGAEGLNAQDGEQLLIRDSVEELVAGISQIWSDPALGEKLARAGHELVKAEYSWEAVARRIAPAIEELQL